MSILVRYDCYTDICEDTLYGKHFLELPVKIRDALNAHFDGQEIDFDGNSNPNNVWMNSYLSIDDKEALIDGAKMLSEDEYLKLEDTGQLESYLEKHREQIEERLRDRFVVLGYDSGEWYLLQ